MYVFILSKFKLPESATANRANVALEEFMAAIKKPAMKQILFETTTIDAFMELLSPK